MPNLIDRQCVLSLIENFRINPRPSVSQNPRPTRPKCAIGGIYHD